MGDELSNKETEKLVTNIETNLAERFKKHHKSEDEFCD
jgi:hypothetical protein